MLCRCGEGNVRSQKEDKGYESTFKGEMSKVISVSCLVVKAKRMAEVWCGVKELLGAAQSCSLET